MDELFRASKRSAAEIAAERAKTPFRSGSRPISRVLSLSSHSSGMLVTEHLEQPTREQCGPHQRSPIWSCSGWGLPCHACYQPCGALLPHHFTLTLPQQSGIFSVALSVGFHPPGVTWHPVLRSPDFPPQPGTNT